MNVSILILLTLSGLIVGGVVSFLIFKNNLKKQSNSLLLEAKKEAEQIKKDKILQAKEKFIELKSEHEKFIFQRNQKVSSAEGRIKEKEEL